jgi:exonuclease SbcC
LAGAGDEAARAQLLAQREDNRKRREQICLHLEILSGVDSPPEWEKQRLAFQVSRLAGHMADGESDPLETDPQLEREWYLCGPAPASSAAALEERFERGRKALSGQESR